MTPKQFREARAKLGLSVADMAQVLGVTELHVRRMAMDSGKQTSRAIQPTMQRLIEAYLDGYRPPDWPVDAHYSD